MSPTDAEQRMLEITVDDENEDDEIILWTVDVMTFRSSGCFIYRWVGWEQKQWSLTTTVKANTIYIYNIIHGSIYFCTFKYLHV